MSKKLIASKVLSNNQKHVIETTEEKWKRNEAAFVRSGYSLEGTEVKEEKKPTDGEKIAKSVVDVIDTLKPKKSQDSDKKENNSTEEN